MGSDLVGDLEEGGCQNRGGVEEVLLAGLFVGLFSDFSPGFW